MGEKEVGGRRWYEIGAGASGEWIGTRETSARRMPRAASERMKTGGQDRVDDSRARYFQRNLTGQREEPRSFG